MLLKRQLSFCLYEKNIIENKLYFALLSYQILHSTNYLIFTPKPVMSSPSLQEFI